MHVAGSIHADVASPAPVWLEKPSDANALDPKLWSISTTRADSGELRIGGLGVNELVERVGTPAYVIDEADFWERVERWKGAFDGWQIYYAGKAFLTTKIARWIDKAGLSLDVCSLGELTVALAAGFDPARIGMHGNNKTEQELRIGIEKGVGRIILDSFDEIERVERLAQEYGVVVPVMIRATTGVEAHTHEYIATAHDDQKFGFATTGGTALVALMRCYHSPRLNLLGVHSHIGSQIYDTDGFEVAARRTLKLFKQFQDATGEQITTLDLGGGFGIAYTSADTPADPETLAPALRDIIIHESRGYGIDVPELSIEPGRAIIGSAGTALYQVGTVKEVDLGGSESRTYISVDGGMSDNIRPALYGAEYSAVLGNRASGVAPKLSRVVGLHCESGDILVRDVFLPGDTGIGDIIAVPASGAYSRSMASNYNHTPRPPVVSVADGKIETLLRRETLEDMLRLDVGYEGSADE
jgi:diaminopimelate decarboxylase